MKRLSLLIILIFCFGCLNIVGDCEVELINKFHNPTNTIQALYVTVDCGATTSTSYSVRLDETNSKKGLSKNTVLSSDREINIRWKSNDTLVIYDSDTTKSFSMKKEFIMPKAKSKVVIQYLN